MKKLLLVVDYQKDFVDGALGFPGAERLDPLIAARILAFRAEGGDVAFTADTHAVSSPETAQEEYLATQEGKHLPVLHCVPGSKGWALYGETASARDPERDLLIEKSTFPSLWLANWLKKQGYEYVELCGLVSHICVLSNAVMVKAALPNAEIVVDARLTASYDPTLHEKALDVLEGIHITVTNRG